MDGFKNSTKMKYMCGGPVRKATGGVIKSAAPKSVAKSAASAKQLPTPEIAPKRQVQPTPPKDVVREAPRPTMEPKRLIAQTPPEDKGRELPRPTMEPKRQVLPAPPKDVRTIGGEPRRSDEGISAKRRLAGTAGDYAAPPEKAKTMSGVPKGVKAGAAAAQTMGAASRDAKTPPKGGGDFAAKIMASKSPQTKIMGGAPEKANDVGDMYRKAKVALRGAEAAPEKASDVGDMYRKAKAAMAAPRGMGGAPAKAISSAVTAKRGVPVASNKPMIGLKTGGYVSKSSFKW